MSKKKKKEQKPSKYWGIGILIAFYLSGLIGLFTPYKQWFLDLTPLNLLVSAAVLLWYDKNKWGKKITILAITFIGGYLAEYAGIHYHFPFGNYTYGPVLGPKLQAVPIIIGINWFIVLYLAYYQSHRFSKNPTMRVFFAAGIATIFDMLIEPVAMHYNFWQWDEGIIPIQNYLGWFGVSALLASFFPILKIKTRSEVVEWLWWLQVMFFVILN